MGKSSDFAYIMLLILSTTISYHTRRKQVKPIQASLRIHDLNCYLDISSI